MNFLTAGGRDRRVIKVKVEVFVTKQVTHVTSDGSLKTVTESAGS